MAGNDRPATNVQLVGGLIWRRGRILLGLRSLNRASCPGCWDVIGGHIEPGEEPVAALRRELREELGIATSRERLVRTVTYNDDHDGPATLHLYLVAQWEGSPAITDDAHSMLGWFTPQDAARLPNLALPSYRTIFLEVGQMP